MKNFTVRFRFCVMVLAALLLVFGNEGLAFAGTESAEVPEAARPWSGWWWPNRLGELVNGYSVQDHAAPLEKYDACVSGWYPGPAVETVGGEVYDPEAELWAGYCHAWAAASILAPEPSEEGDLNGVRFRVGDKKGLLTLHYHRNYQSVMLGNRYASALDDPDDIYPLEFHQTLRAYILGEGLPVVMDIDPGTAVWNYPAYKYEMEWTDASGFRDVECTVWLANDSVHSPDDVGTVAATLTYTYRLEIDENGTLKDAPGEWLGESADSHPDFLWFPEIFLDQEVLLNPDRVSAIIDSLPDDASEDLFEENDSLTTAFPIQTLVPDRYYIGRLNDPDWFRAGLFEGDAFLARVPDQAPPDLAIGIFDAAGVPVGNSMYHMNYIDKASFTGPVFVEINTNEPGALYDLELSQWPVTLVPHVAPPNWRTELTLFNPGDEVNYMRKNLFSQGNQVVEESSFQVGAKCMMRIPAMNDPDAFEPEMNHHMRLVNTLVPYTPVAPAPIASVIYEIKGQLVNIPLASADTIDQTTLYGPHLEFAGRWWTGLALQNPDPSAALHITFQIYNEYGSRIMEEQAEIPAGENRSAQIGEYFTQPVPPAAAWFEIVADRPVSGFILWGNYKDLQDPGICGIPLLSSKNAARTLYVPHLEVRGDWWTGVALVNPNDEAALVTFDGYSANGLPLCSEVHNVPSKGRWCDVIQNAFSGWIDEVAWVKITANRPIIGFQLIGWRNNQLAAMGLQTADDLATDLVFVLPEEDARWSGLALLNPGDQSTKITAVPYGRDGSRLIPGDKPLDGGMLIKNSNRVALVRDFFTSTLPEGTAYLTLHVVNEELTAVTGLGLYQAANKGLDRLVLTPY